MSDYNRIAEAINFINLNVKQQPSLEEIANHLHMSPFHFQRLFSRWVGVSPKRYLQILTLGRAKQLLKDAPSLLDVSHELGLSSSSRLYDHFVRLDAVTPGEYKSEGRDVTIHYGEHESPFGPLFIAMTSRGICRMGFLDYVDKVTHLSSLELEWPQAEIIEDHGKTQVAVKSIFSNQNRQDRPISLHVRGTNFQICVWRALMQIPSARVVSYTHLAKSLGRPHAARAVGTAVGANPVALLIPCHRVIRMSGHLGGYHWGETRLHAIHAWETAQDER